MKKFLNLVIALAMVFSVASCTTVDAGHKGVEISWGGETNMNNILPEGMDMGMHWLWDDVVQYDVREHTMVKKFSFNDKNDMTTEVVVALDYNLDPNQVNKLHAGINDYEVKIATSLSSAAKEVVPQYSAVDLNKHKRNEGEALLREVLQKELPEFFVQFKRVRFTDINIPSGISKLAEETAVQLGRNELASKKEAEQVALAKAKVAEAQGNYDAGILQAKTKDLLSSPKMLELIRVENESKMWNGFIKHGKSPYGENNIFGSETAIVRGLK
jgi:regulator of protease activity HflC (stomatin/prohibitin superfamily)